MKKILFVVMLALLSLNVFAQDLIVKKDGSIIQAKVEEIGTSEVSYKKWTNQDGPTYSISKNDILSITYQDGSQDKFQTVATSNVAMTSSSATPNETSSAVNRSNQSLMKQSSPSEQPFLADPNKQTYGVDEWESRFGCVFQMSPLTYWFGDGLDGFNGGQDYSFGLRFYATEGLYLEGLFGYRWMSYHVGDVDSKEHAFTIPIHIGYQFPESGLDFSFGPRIDCPFSYKAEYKGEKLDIGKPDSHTALEFSVQLKGSIGVRFGFGVSDGNEAKYLSLVYTL